MRSNGPSGTAGGVAGWLDLTEHELNPALRRTDWRFLLANPRPKRTFSLATGHLADAITLVSEQVVSADVPGTADCDLAVAADPDPRALRLMWQRLVPGGHCYSEWRSFLSGGGRQIAATLQAAGFRDVTCYAPWPPPSIALPTLWVPLHAPGAAAHGSARRLPAAGLLRRAAAEAFHASWRSALRLGVVRPICALARKPAEDGRCGPRDLLGWVRSGWHAWDLGPQPERLSALLLTGGPRSISKVVCLVFAEPESDPRLAIKLPRVTQSAAGVRREAATLEALGRRRPALRGVPHMLFCHELDGVPALGETAVSGRPLFSVLDRRTHRHWALKGVDWLVDLFGRSAPRAAAEWQARLVEPMLAEFCRSFGPVVDSGLLRQAEEILATLGDVPAGCE